MKVSIRDSSIHVHTFGEGEEVLIAVHGFSKSGDQFAPMAPYLKGRFRIYAIDLPWHGQSDWNETRYRPEDIEQVVHTILKLAGVETYWLCGYSLGARIVFNLLKRQPESVNGLILLAPDGLRTRWLSSLQRTPFWMKRHFASWIMKRPHQLFALTKWLSRRGWIDRYAEQFIDKHFTKEPDRYRSVHNWQSMDHFQFSTHDLALLIRTNHMPLHIYYGVLDPLVAAESVEAFATQCGTTATPLRVGHHILREPLFVHLKAVLLPS